MEVALVGHHGRHARSRKGKEAKLCSCQKDGGRHCEEGNYAARRRFYGGKDGEQKRERESSSPSHERADGKIRK